MQRTNHAPKHLSGYTRGEERFHMVSHIVGGVLGVVAVLTCVIVAAYHRNIWGIVSGAIYGVTVILLFTMSSIYHGLAAGRSKRVFQILDHCTIFLLIAGTYTPILLNQFRKTYPVEAWAILILVWGLAILGIVLNAIDLRRFQGFSIACYLGMGWLSVFSLPRLMQTLGRGFFTLLLLGGILYTVGATIYVVGKKTNRKYMHGVFHIFVDVAALLHFLGIVIFTMSP